MGINCVEIDDNNYPKALKEALKHLIYSQGPKRLYYKGSWDEDIFKNCLAVVGSRHLTSYGRKATEQIVTEVAAAGVTIVSGFMYGGDEAAHSAAIKAGGRTIAVMPCGIDRIHPESQKELYKKILDNNGLVISEYESDLQPQTFTYVQRDRIVAGLSKAVLVTEAALGSGSLITAGYATKYGRKIFAIPGQITSELAKGTTKLIKEGAEAVADASDILKFFKVLVNPKSPSKSRVFCDRKKHGQTPLDSLEGKILNQLGREVMSADDLARLFTVPVAQLGTTLSLMQLKGMVKLENNKYYLS